MKKRGLGRCSSLALACAVVAFASGPLQAQTDSLAIRRAERQRIAQEKLLNDWADLAHYRTANESLGSPKRGEKRVVFIGDSITELWAPFFPTLFPGKPYIGRGISGQTTPQILIRFRQDVIALKPRVVVILAGTNDIAGNTGPSSLEMIEDNLASMTEISRANGVRVVLASVLPAYDYSWKRGLEPAGKIVALNAWIKRYAKSVGVSYVDFHSSMADERGGLRKDLSEDGVHPNLKGFQTMTPLAQKAIEKALLKPVQGRVPN